MDQKSNKVLTVFVVCFYLFALGSFGIRARWVFAIILVLTTIAAAVSGGLRVLKISSYKRNWLILYGIIAIFILLPNARHETDIINYLVFVTITTYVVLIAKIDDAEIYKVKKIMIQMGLFFAMYVSFFRIFPSLYEATIYRLLAASVKEAYRFGGRLGYGLAIGNGYTFSDSAVWLGIAALVSKDLAEGEKGAKNKVFLIIMLAGMLLEGRKGELLSAIITVVFLYYYGSSRDIRALGKRLLYIVGIVLVGIVALRFFNNAGLLQRFTLLFERLVQVRAGNTVDFTSGRFELWGNAINLFKQYPIVGAGWGRFANYTEGHYQAVIAEGLRNTHNVFLQLLCETGIVGTTAIVLSLASIIARMFRNARSLKKNKERREEFDYTLFSIGILIYSVILSFLDPNFYGQYFWCMFAIAFIIEDFTILSRMNMSAIN